EAEGVLAWKLRLVWTHEFLADERGQPRRHLRLLGRERLDRAQVEHPALDRAALEDLPLVEFELVEAGGEQGLDRRRHNHFAVARLLNDRAHRLDQERVALGRLTEL